MIGNSSFYQTGMSMYKPTPGYASPSFDLSRNQAESHPTNTHTLKDGQVLPSGEIGQRLLAKLPIQ